MFKEGRLVMYRDYSRVFPFIAFSKDKSNINEFFAYNKIIDNLAKLSEYINIRTKRYAIYKIKNS
jgi:hypothetical protein